MAEPKIGEEGRKIRLVWDPGENVTSHYANHLLVSFAGGTEFHVVFGHLSPPLTTDDSEIPDHLTVKPVAKLVITPVVMKAFIQVLNDHFAKFERLLAETEGSDA